MPSDKEIADQHKRLATNRANLSHLRNQLAQVGGDSHASLDLLNSIEGTRAEIQRIKGVLRGWRELVEDLPDDGDGQPSGARRRVFLSYKRDFDPDEGLARAVKRELEAAHDVFVDRDLPVGVPWAESIRAEIERCDALIVLLSARAIESEMVREEIALAYRLMQRQGRPRILPVRVANRQPFPYPLDSMLNQINWAEWGDPGDTERLVRTLKRSLESNGLPPPPVGEGSGGSAQPPPQQGPPPADAQLPRATTARSDLESPEGTMDPDSAFYVERANDPLALESVRRNGVTITIKGPRQVGKSSLLMRLIAAAQEAGKRVAFLDFQLFDQSALKDQESFYRQFCVALSDLLDLEDRTEEYWTPALGYNHRCTNYVRRYLLKQSDAPLLLALDEVETLFDSAFRSDFFGMLRHWHNSRATMRDWKRLDMALVTSTEPYLFIDNLTQSPFNVGQIIDLEDFTAAQIHQLNLLHDTRLAASDEQRLHDLLNGHPYLTRRALYLIASGRLPLADLFTHAAEMRGPFGDHLRSILFRLHTKPDLVTGLLQVINRGTCDDRIFFRLHGAGLLRAEGRTIRPRCKLYADFFGEHLR